MSDYICKGCGSRKCEVGDCPELAVGVWRNQFAGDVHECAEHGRKGPGTGWRWKRYPKEKRGKAGRKRSGYANAAM